MNDIEDIDKLKKNNTHSLRIIRLIGFVLSALIVCCILKITYTLVAEGERWRTIGENINRPEKVILSPIRGSIYDNEGRLIAITAPYFRLYFDFQADAFTQIEKDSMNRMMDSLATLISNKFANGKHPISKKELLSNWAKGRAKKSRYWPIYRYNISYLEMKEMWEKYPLAPMKKGHKTVGSPFNRFITKEEQSSRLNPYGSLAMRTIGRVYGDMDKGVSHARNGIELAYDSLLKGKTGSAVKVYVGGKRNLNTTEEPERGANVYSTINMDIQSIVENVLRQRLIDVDAGSGTCVLMEVSTGKILAISNLGKTGDGQYAETLNYALQDMSEPGSTFKTASMMVALDDGVVHADDVIDVGNGLWKVGGRTVRDHNASKGGYGKITAAQCIQYSSNVGVAKVIQSNYASHPDDYVEKIRKLGFGIDLGLEIEGYEKAIVRKRSDNPNRWYGTTLAWMSYGYESQIPPIYTLAFYNAIANNGVYMRPYFVNKIVSSKGDVILENEPKVLIQQICKPTTLSIIQQMLHDVVWKGTGKPIQSDVVSISGKTGTAQLAAAGGKGYKSESRVRYQVSFCGYFPSKNPKYSCIAVVREPNPARAYPGGGNVAGPIVRSVAEHMLAIEQPLPITEKNAPIPTTKFMPTTISSGLSNDILPLLKEANISHDKTDAPWVIAKVKDNKFYLTPYPDYKKSIMPPVVGMSAKDAVYMLMSRGLKPSVVGFGNVKEQRPAAGTPIKPGMQTTLILTYTDDLPTQNDEKKS